MKILVYVARWLAVVLAAVLAPIAIADKQYENSCSSRDFRGLYAYQLSGSDLRNDPPTAFSASGVLNADGRGRVTYWKDAFSVHLPGATVKTVVPDIDMVAAAQAAGSEIIYDVGPDCRLNIVFTAMTPVGPVDFHLLGAIANRGREILLQTGTPYILGTGVAKPTGRRWSE